MHTTILCKHINKWENPHWLCAMVWMNEQLTDGNEKNTIFSSKGIIIQTFYYNSYRTLQVNHTVWQIAKPAQSVHCWFNYQHTPRPHQVKPSYLTSINTKDINTVGWAGGRLGTRINWPSHQSTEWISFTVVFHQHCKVCNHIIVYKHQTIALRNLSNQCWCYSMHTIKDYVKGGVFTWSFKAFILPGPGTLWGGWAVMVCYKPSCVYKWKNHNYIGNKHGL